MDLDDYYKGVSRIAFYEREEPVSLKKVRHSQVKSRFSSPLNYWPTTIPTEILILNKGIWDHLPLFRATGLLCRISFWSGDYSLPLPLHLAAKMVSDRPENIREKANLH